MNRSRRDLGRQHEPDKYRRARVADVGYWTDISEAVELAHPGWPCRRAAGTSNSACGAFLPLGPDPMGRISIALAQHHLLLQDHMRS